MCSNNNNGGIMYYKLNITEKHFIGKRLKEKGVNAAINFIKTWKSFIPVDELQNQLEKMETEAKELGVNISDSIIFNKICSFIEEYHNGSPWLSDLFETPLKDTPVIVKLTNGEHALGILIHNEIVPYGVETKDDVCDVQFTSAIECWRYFHV